MNRRTFVMFAASAALGLTALRAHADAHASALAAVPEPRVVGKGRLSVLMVPVLDVTLFGPQGQWRQDQPYAIRVDYLVDLDGPHMAKHAVDQMRSAGCKDTARLAAWHGRLAAILPDVKRGDTLYGVRTAAGTTGFYLGDRPLGAIQDPAFTDAFFAICLSPRTTQPNLRRQLLGGRTG